MKAVWIHRENISRVRCRVWAKKRPIYALCDSLWTNIVEWEYGMKPKKKNLKYIEHESSRHNIYFKLLMENDGSDGI